MYNMVIHPGIKELAKLFNSNGKEIYLVGGAVRDMLRGSGIHDWDLATNARPDEVNAIVRKAGGKVIPTGIKHGTVTVIFKKQSSEVTTFRTEADYSDGRRPDKVHFATTIEEDLSRRDFTMNAIALRLPACEVIDPFGGKADIKAGIIRCVGKANERFSEDGLRPLRAIRFASQLGYRLEQDTLDAIPGALSIAAKVSWERVRDEIDKILGSSSPSCAFLLMEKTGLLSVFLDELAVCRGIEQKGFHKFDVLDHSLAACDYAAQKGYSREVRLAALLHDVGKPAVRQMDDTGLWTFYRHEEVSRQMSRKILLRLRYSNSVIDTVCHLIKEHMFHYTEAWTDAAVRRFAARVGTDYLSELYQLRLSDSYGFEGKEPPVFHLTELADRVEKILAAGNALSVKDLAISGSDLITIGIKPGKTMGLILRRLLEAVIEDPEQNNKEKLLEIAQKMYVQMTE
jgi:putative nucleotidyltransferase with HDIG domain